MDKIPSLLRGGLKQILKKESYCTAYVKYHGRCTEKKYMIPAFDTGLDESDPQLSML